VWREDEHRNFGGAQTPRRADGFYVFSLELELDPLATTYRREGDLHVCALTHHVALPTHPTHTISTPCAPRLARPPRSYAHNEAGSSALTRSPLRSCRQLTYPHMHTRARALHGPHLAHPTPVATVQDMAYSPNILDRDKIRTCMLYKLISKLMPLKLNLY
jgi:hypothetical protein